MRFRLVVASLGIGCASRFAGCYGATEYTIELSTDVKCTDFRGFTITTGRLRDIETDSPATAGAVCDPQGKLGTLVVVPSGAQDEPFAVKVIVGLARDPASCVPPAYGKGCIVARRALRFVKHESLRVPIALQAICDGIPCGETQTCSGGACVPADDPNAVVPRDGGAADAGGDGGGGPLACGDTTGLEPGSPWPMAGGCPAHTGRSAAVGPRTVKLRWASPLGSFDPLSSGPAVAADGTIYVQSSNGGLDAYRPKDGSMEGTWNIAANNINATPVIAQSGTIYEGSQGVDGLYAVPPHSLFGADRPFGKSGAPVIYSPTIGADGTIYVPAFHLFALNPDGSTKWAFPPEASPRLLGISAPAIGSSGVVYFGASDGALHAVKPDGTLAWSRLTDVARYASPSIGQDGTIYIGASKKVYAVNPDGTTKWTSATGGAVDAMPAIASNGTIIVGAEDGKLYAIRSDGKLRWAADAVVGGVDPRSSPTGGASAVIDGTGAVFVGAGPGTFRAFSAEGKVMWEFVSPSCPTCRFGSAAIGTDGTIYAPADKLYAFAP